MKFLIVALLSAFSIQSSAFTIECLSENNLDVSRLDFYSLKIESTSKGNWITINDKTTKLGESLPYKLDPRLRPTTQAESFTVLTPLQLGVVTFPAGTALSYRHNRMELKKYRDTVVTFVDFGKRIKLDIDCQLLK